MSKEVVIKGAEVVPFYGTQETYKANKTEKGSYVINFNVKTKVNDRVPNAPHLYEQCHIWLKSEDEAETVKGYLKAGNILQLTGTEDQSKYTKDGKDVYKRQIKVQTITPIVVDETDMGEQPNADENLPF